MDPNEEAHWGISSEQMTELAGDHEVGTCIYILDCNKYSALNSWRNTEHTSDCLTLSRLYFPHHFCPPTELVQQSSLTFLDPFIKGFPNQNNQTGPTFHTKDIFYWIKNFLKEATQPHTFVMDIFNRFIILSDNCITINKLCGIYSSQNLRTFIKYRGSSGSDNKMSVIKHGSAQRSSCLVTSCEDTDRDYLSTCKPKSHQKSSRNDEHPRRPWRRDETETMKMKMKSVSFEEDVIVYLFDQKTPTIKLQSEPRTPLPFNYPCHLPDVMSEDNDLQWEDDFSALEFVRQPATVSVQTNGWTSRTGPECCFRPKLACSSPMSSSQTLNCDLKYGQPCPNGKLSNCPDLGSFTCDSSPPPSSFMSQGFQLPFSPLHAPKHSLFMTSQPRRAVAQCIELSLPLA